MPILTLHKAVHASQFSLVTSRAMLESGRGTSRAAVSGLQVDLVVCYDAHASPIRDLQRCGRTGRQRGGRVVQLLALGREELSYEKQQLACFPFVPFCLSFWTHAML